MIAFWGLTIISVFSFGKLRMNPFNGEEVLFSSPSKGEVR